MNILLFHPVAAFRATSTELLFLHLLHHTRNTRKRQTKKPPEGHGHAMSSLRLFLHSLSPCVQIFGASLFVKVIPFAVDDDDQRHILHVELP